MKSDVVGMIGDRIDKSGRILVISHIRPDGDAVGSLVGLGLSLAERGKQLEMVISDGVSTERILVTERMPFHPTRPPTESMPWTVPVA